MYIYITRILCLYTQLIYYDINDMTKRDTHYNSTRHDDIAMIAEAVINGQRRHH